MKIDRDLLNLLKIDTVYILANDTIYLCCPMEINRLHWLVTADSAELPSSAKLKVKYRGSFIYLESTVKKKSIINQCAFCYEININENETDKDDFKKSFFQEVQKLEEKTEGWNLRKEIRYEIGLNESKQKMMNFKEAQQMLVYEKQTLPCLINNLSYSGAKITTLESDFQKEKKICLYLSFKNPIEQIPIVAAIRNCSIKTTQEKKVVAVLSLKFDSSPVSYKERLENFITESEKNSNGNTVL